MQQRNVKGLRTWIEIDTDRLQQNYQTFRKLVGPEVLLMSVAKSNAYGHSLVDFAQAMARCGVDWLAVDSIVEGLKLREHHLTVPILVLGHTLPEMVMAAEMQNISLTISNWEALEDLRVGAPDKLKIHLKFDTGMSRQGFFPEETAKVLDFIKAHLPGVIIEGAYTHFAAAKNPSFPTDTRKQIAQFDLALAEMAKRNIKVIRHAAATSGAIVFPESRFDLVRIGIGFYGLWPSIEVKYAFGDKIKLAPILTWKTVVSEIKTVPLGERVGYDFTEHLERETVIGILPVGYWHGYDRSLSSIGRVLVQGKRCRVLGRVSMDMLAVDLTEVPGVKVGAEVTLLGQDGAVEFSAEEMASLAETSAYEIITRLNPLIKRVYI